MFSRENPQRPINTAISFEYKLEYSAIFSNNSHGVSETSHSRRKYRENYSKRISVKLLPSLACCGLGEDGIVVTTPIAGGPKHFAVETT